MRRADHIMELVESSLTKLGRDRKERTVRLLMEHIGSLDSFLIDEPMMLKRMKKEGIDAPIENPLVTSGVLSVQLFFRLSKAYSSFFFIESLRVNSKCSSAIGTKVIECDEESIVHIGSESSYVHCLNLPLRCCDLIVSGRAIPFDQTVRCRGFILRSYLLRSLHLYLPRELKELGAFEDHSFETIDDIPSLDEINRRDIVKFGRDQKIIAMGEHFIWEVHIAKTLMNLKTQSLSIPSQPILPLNEEQKMLGELLQTEGIVCLIGIGGTGKSFTLMDLVLRMAKMGLDFWICAFTGKASSRFRELASEIPQAKEYKDHISSRSSTIHALINDRENHSVDVLIVDEASMVSTELMSRLLLSKRPRTIILSGDNNQLHPIDRGAPFEAIVASRTLPTLVLKKLMRAQGSLSHLCQKIVQAEDRSSLNLSCQSLMVQKSKSIMSSCADIYKKVNEMGEPRSVAIITPTNRMRVATNRLIQMEEARSKGLPFLRFKRFEGDEEILTEGCKVMFSVRNHYGLNIFNGEIGKISRVIPLGSLTLQTIEPFLVRDANDFELSIRINEISGALDKIEGAICSFSQGEVFVATSYPFSINSLVDTTSNLGVRTTRIIDTSFIQGGECITIHKCLLGSSIVVSGGIRTTLRSLARQTIGSLEQGVHRCSGMVMTPFGEKEFDEIFIGDSSPIFTLSLEKGFSIEGTGEHLLLTQDGWVEMRSLRRSHRVHLMLGEPVESPDPEKSIGLIAKMIRRRGISPQRGGIMVLANAREAECYQASLRRLGLLVSRDEEKLSIPSDWKARIIMHFFEFPSGVGFTYLRVLKLEGEDRKMRVFDLHMKEEPHCYLANGLITHNSQSSEWDIVILGAEPSSLSLMGNFNLVYTAISRAKDKIIVVGDTKDWEGTLGRPAPKRFQLVGCLLSQLDGRNEEPDVGDEVDEMSE